MFYKNTPQETKMTPTPLSKAFEELQINPTLIQREKVYREAEASLEKLHAVETLCTKYMRKCAVLKKSSVFKSWIKQDTHIPETWEKLNLSLKIAQKETETLRKEHDIPQLEKKIAGEERHFVFMKYRLLGILKNAAEKYYGLLTTEYDKQIEERLFTPDHSFDLIQAGGMLPSPKIPTPHISTSTRTEFNAIFNHIAKIDEKNFLHLAEIPVHHYNMADFITLMISANQKADTFYHRHLNYSDQNPYMLLQAEMRYFRQNESYVKKFSSVYAELEKTSIKELITPIQKENIEKLSSQHTRKLQTINGQLSELAKHLQYLKTTAFITSLLQSNPKIWRPTLQPLLEEERTRPLTTRETILDVVTEMVEKVGGSLPESHAL